jgi:dTDP-glucose pyrophosphorylase
MVIQALRDLPKTDSQTFVLRKDLQGLGILKSELNQASSNAQFSILQSITDGQATTCIEGSKNLEMNSKVTIAACDNGMNYDSKLFDKMMIDDSVDIIVWAARGYPGAIRSPESYGWIDVDDQGYIKRVSVKTPLSDPKNDPIIVGAFTFKCLSDLIDAVDRMKSRKARVKGEYYIDTAINDAIQIGKKCKILEIEHYICWGTPEDLQTFEYWQSCFHRWNSHKYRLEDDPCIEPESLPLLKQHYSKRWKNRNTY